MPLALLLVPAVSACGDLIADPHPREALGFAVVAAGGPSAALARADNAIVRLSAADRPVLDTVLAIMPGAGEVRLRVAVPDSLEDVSLNIDLEIRVGSSALFRGQATASPAASADHPVEVAVDPVIAGLAPPVDFLLDEIPQVRELNVAAVLATGDTVPGVPVAYRVVDEGVVELVGGRSLRALREGTATVEASHGGLRVTFAATVELAFVIRSIERVQYGHAIIDDLERNAFPRGGLYRASIRGNGLNGMTTFRAHHPDVTGRVLSATDSEVIVELFSSHVEEGQQAAAPIPAVGFQLDGGARAVDSEPVTFEIITGPAPVPLGMRIANGITTVPRGVPVRIDYEASFLTPGNIRVIFVGGTDGTVEWGDSGGDGFEFTVRFSITTDIAATSTYPSYGWGSGVVLGSGHLGRLDLAIPVVDPSPGEPAGARSHPAVPTAQATRVLTCSHDRGGVSCR